MPIMIIYWALFGRAGNGGGPVPVRCGIFGGSAALGIGAGWRWRDGNGGGVPIGGGGAVRVTRLGLETAAVVDWDASLALALISKS